MSPNLASLACCCIIVTAYVLNYDRKEQAARALWIPVAWLTICASRMVSQWISGEYMGIVQSGQEFADGNSLDAFIFAALLAAGLVVLVARRRRVITLLRGNAPLLIFLGYCLISVVWSDYPFVAFKRWIKAIGDLVMVLILFTDAHPTAATKRLFARGGFLLIPLSILFIRYYPSIGRAYSDWTGDPYNIGVATGKNGLGFVCLIFGLGSLWFLLETIRRGDRGHKLGPILAHGGILVLTLWLFHMAHSATSFSCFLIGGVLMAATRLRLVIRKPALIYFISLTLLFVVVYGLFLNPGAGLTEAVGRDSTLTGRTALWGLVLPMAGNRFLGVGYESFWLGPRLEQIWKMNWEHPNQAHNGYLEVYLDLGWVGLLLLGFVIVYGYRGAIRSLRWNPELGRLKLALLIVALIYNLTEHAFRELHPVWIAFLLAVTVSPPCVRREAA
jgi:exopolysaccharide production protein ExoQ